MPKSIVYDGFVDFEFNSSALDAKYVGYTYDNASACTKSSPCISSFNSSSSTFSNNKTVTNSSIKSTLENWYKEKLASYDSKIALSSFCNDTSYTLDGSYYYYGAQTRTGGFSPSLKCPDTSQTYGGNYKLKIGLLTTDESNFAGLGLSTSSSNAAQSTNYIYSSVPSTGWYSMSPKYWRYKKSYVFLNRDGSYNGIDYATNYERGVFPVINLNSNVDITGGDGTSSNPYTIG